MSVVIERVVHLPRSELARLVAESEQAGWRFLCRLLDEWSTGENRFDRAGEGLLVARDEGRLVGVCGLNVDPYSDHRRVGRIRHLYAAAACRRRGIGRQLVQQLISMSRGTFDRLRLRTESPEAARFYEMLGFPPRAGVADCTHVLELKSSRYMPEST